MSFALLVDRARADYAEMPGLELTIPQAVRLWNLGMDDCRSVIDALVDAGFLKWTAKRTLVRTGLNLPVDHRYRQANISVPLRRPPNKSV